jgi:acyl-coenzyme A synthetase/AMP-(fatty) acid ligase
VGIRLTGTLGDEIAAACRRWEGCVALVNGRSAVTYGQFIRATDCLIRAYAELGIAPGNRILCQLPNGILHLAVAVANWRYGTVHVVADRDLSADEVIQRVRDARPAAAVVDAMHDEQRTTSTVRALQAEWPNLTILTNAGVTGGPERSLLRLLDGTAAPPTPFAGTGPSPDDPALILFTSGTTGKSKGVVRYHKQLVRQWRSAGEVMEVHAGDVHLVQLPLSHGFGLGMAILGLMFGGKLVIMEKFSAEGSLETITEQKVTILHGTPAHFTLFTDRLHPTRHDVSSLRIGQGSGAGFSPDVVRKVFEKLGMDLMLVYGCSEGLHCYTTDRDDMLRGSVGRPAPGRVRIMKEGRPAEQGELGEIAFRRVHRFRYLGETEAASEWHLTGDLGRFDVDGRLYVLGRARYVINRGGIKIAPEEVEACLERYPGLVECAVVALPDRVVGEKVCACLVSASGTAPSLSGIREFLGRSLARHKLPEELCVLEEIPKVQLGKIDRPALARLAAQADRERLDRER